MCDLDKEFKLCSCDGEKLSDEEVGWILRRYDANIPQKIIRGMMSAPIPVLGTKKHIRTLIVTELNSRNCFDFDYKPRDGDHLDIKVEETRHASWVSYKFHSGKWVIDSGGTMGVSQQLKFVKEGKIDKKLGVLFLEEAKSMLTEADLKELEEYNSPMILMLKKMKEKEETAENGAPEEVKQEITEALVENKVKEQLNTEAKIKEKLLELYKKLDEEKTDDSNSNE